MPKETFLNLPEDKRARFVEEALVEFAEHPYDSASISRIVRRLGIAKGSVYQYFDDKLDLFRWLLEEAGRRKLAHLAEARGDDLFTRLRVMYVSGLRFWRAEPRWARLGLRLQEPSREARLEELRRQTEAAGHAFLEELFVEARGRGELRTDVDPTRAAYLAAGLLQRGLLDAFLAEARSHSGASAPRLDAVSDEALLAIVDAAIDLLRRGIGASDVQPPSRPPS